jgi:hypothetical protein
MRTHIRVLGPVLSMVAPSVVFVVACGSMDDHPMDDTASSESVSASPSFTVQSAPNEFLQAASATSATDVWAVGQGQAIAPDGTEFVHASVLHFNGASWTRVPAPVDGDTDAFSFVQFTGVTAISPSNAWLVGDHVQASNGAIAPFIKHWNGTSWSTFPSPTFPAGSASLNAIAHTSATDIWAVGTFPGFFIDPLVEHFDGHTWTQISPPAIVPGDAFDMRGVSADSPTDVWVVGSESQQDGAPPTLTRVLHFDGAKWQFVPSPSVFPPGGGSDQLYGVVALSPTDVWAVGTVTANTGGAQTLIEHYDGTSWKVVPSPNPAPDSELWGVTAVSSQDIYAVGFQRTSVTKTLVVHWNGSTWSVLPSPNPTAPSVPLDDLLFGAASLADGNVWLVGVGGNPHPPDPDPSIVLHASGG